MNTRKIENMKLRLATYYRTCVENDVEECSLMLDLSVDDARKRLMNERTQLEYSFNDGVDWLPIDEVRICDDCLWDQLEGEDYKRPNALSCPCPKCRLGD